MAEATLKMLLLGEDRTASKSLKGVGDQAVKTEKHTSHLGSSFAKAGKVAAIGLAGGLAAAGAAMVGMVKNGADDLAAQRKLAVALHNTTGATKEQVKGVESWISKQGVALGVTDDELRPALQRLVQSTGNVSEAQKLAGVAMDASAGSGKSLKVVSEAIAKAHNGNLGALSRLGVKIKDTDGKTLSFNDAMKEMGKTFKGQAAAGANTFDGKMGRLKLMFDETKETIGQALIPMLTKLADWFLKLVKGMQNGTGAGGDLRDAFNKVGDVVKKVGPVLTGVFKFLVDNKAAVGAFIAVLVGFKILKSIRDGFIALNLAMEANPIGLVVVAIAALAAGLVYAYKHSETFRNIVNGVFHAVASAASHMWNDVIKPVFKFLINTWLTVAGALINGAARAFGWVPGIGPKLKKAAAWFNDFKTKVNDQLDGIHDKTVKFKVNSGNSFSDLNNIKTVLGEIKSKKVLLTVNTSNDLAKPHHAVGTSFFAGGMTRVGERGPEDVYLPRGSTIQTAQASARARAAGSPDLHVTAPLVLKLDSREVWQGMLALKRNRGGVTLGLA